MSQWPKILNILKHQEAPTHLIDQIIELDHKQMVKWNWNVLNTAIDNLSVTLSKINLRPLVTSPGVRLSNGSVLIDSFHQ